MIDTNVEIHAAGRGLVECEASDVDKKTHRICAIGISTRAWEKDVDWEWSEPEPVGEGALLLKAKGSGLDLELVFSDNGDFISIDLTLRPAGSRAVNYCLLNLDFLPGGKLDDCHVPHLVPKPGLVMSEMIFRSPAIVVRSGSLGAALLPDLDRLRETRPAPWIMDFDETGPEGVPRLSLGLMKSHPHRHVYFKGEPDERIAIPDEGLKLSGHLILSADAGRDFERKVLNFLWDRYGVSHYNSVRPQILSLDEQAKIAMERLYRDDFYHEFEYKGATRGGLTTFTATAEKPLKPVSARFTKIMSHFNGLGMHFLLTILNLVDSTLQSEARTRKIIHKFGIPKLDQTWFQSWFNCMRTAYGSRILADRWGDEKLAGQSNRIKDLALSAPVEDGIFSMACFYPEGRVWWMRGSLSFWAVNDYYTPDQATTGYMMLKWYRDIERQPELLDMARGLGKFFLKHLLPSGALPSWIKGGSHKHMDRLLESASTAGPLMFMAMLASMDNDEAVLDGARRMADFIEREVIPEHKWIDYETVYSCSRHFGKLVDPRSGRYARNSMSIGWATEGARLLYEITGEEKHLELMLRCLDDLLWHQQIWDAPVHSIDTFGGFGSQNTDAEWNDARQGQFAPILLDIYKTTGDPHHFQRGVSAVRSCYTTMLHPAFEEVAPGNMVNYRESDKGAVYENYGHAGFDNVIGGYQHADWGAGTAAFATGHALKHYGDVFIDLNHGHAFGINGCAVNAFEREGDKLRLDIESKIPGHDQWRVVIRGAGPDTTLFVNGTGHPFDIKED